MEALTPGLVAELACSARDWDGFERETTALLLEAIGADTVFFSDGRRISAHGLGVIEQVRDRIQPLWPELAAQSAVLLEAALRAGGTLIDSEVMGKDLERMPYYDALMRPVRGRTTLIGVVTPAGCVSHKIAIGRCWGSSPFRSRHSRLLASVLPTISLARAALAARKRQGERGELLGALTPREREVLGYLRLGYTNEQIGAALGTRARTVRNQLSRVYEKLGVATRAEAVGLCGEQDL